MRLGWCILKQNRRTEHCKLQFDQISKRCRSPLVYLASLTTSAVLHFTIDNILYYLCILVYYLWFYIFMDSHTSHNCYISVSMATAGPRQSLKQGKRLHSQTKEIILNVYSYFESLSKSFTLSLCLPWLWLRRYLGCSWSVRFFNFLRKFLISILTTVISTWLI